ncbi:MAG: alpha-L-fucosidase, partial [Planctomycetes bacterium]|nr:alpha-L-fucosidase [Planctomycetota bacterium]
MRRTRAACLVALAIGCLTALAAATEAPKYEPNWASLDARPLPAWFNEARFGVFIVWGPYSVPSWAPKGQYAEWYGNHMRNRNSPTWKFHAKTYGENFKYEEFAPRLTAEMWDPEAWADLFVRSGARYVVLSANYHDGYCLWPSPYAKGWNAMDVGPKRDVLGDMTDAVRKRGLKMGIYYSLYEWYHPLWLSDRPRYVAEHFHPQFKDVITRYRPSIIFADGEWEGDDKLWRSEELLAWLFSESPAREDIVVNDRWGGGRGRHGSFYESEYGGGNMSPKHPWQEDRGMGRSYGYNRMESIDEYDSAAEMIRMLTRCAGNGGNYLLCIGPTADGRIPVIMQERLLQIGAWLKVNGDAVYGSQAGPFWPRKMPWGTCTYKPGRLFLHFWTLPAGPVTLPGLKNKVTAIYRLADKDKRPVAQPRQTDAGVTFDMPDLPDFRPEAEGAAVLVAEIEGEPSIDMTIRQAADGTITLRAVEADIHGTSPQYESGDGKDNIGFWQNPKDSVSWRFRVERP